MQDLRTIKILIVDGHGVVASGIAKILEEVEGFHVIGLSKSGEEMFRIFEYSTDIVLIDIELPGSIRGLEVIRRLRQISPHTRIMILTNNLDTVLVHDALREGALSYLLKNSSSEAVIRAIRDAHHGISTLSPEVMQVLVRGISAPNATHLTSREREVLDLLSKGLNNQKIAKQLNISLSTVQFHVSNILGKLGVHNRIEAAMFAVQHRLASQEAEVFRRE
jgi:NarL family two-component system response regulator LiaR